MTNFGTIKAYDSGNGSGTIAPEQGGEPLHFGKNDVQQRAAEPQQGQRYGYDTKQAGGGKVHATNLRQHDREEALGQTEAGDRQAQQARQQMG